MNKKILFIFAHPDDEAFGPACTIAKYARQGAEIFLTTITRGEAGTLGPARWLTPEELANLRTKELECAVEVLGIKHLHQFDLPDGQLTNFPDTEALYLIQQEIRNILPDLIITFHPNGISGHPDHIQVTRWVYETICQMEESPRLLYYGVSGKQVKMIKFRQLFSMSDEEITHKISVENFFIEKLKAIDCHSSQKELWEKLQEAEGGYKAYVSFDHFSQVIPPIRVEQPYPDLFPNS